MKKIPSCLNNILRDRYLKEAVTTAPQISYIKKEEEIEDKISPSIVGRALAPKNFPQFGPPELVMPPASQFPRLSPLESAKPVTLQDIVDGLNNAANTSAKQAGKLRRSTDLAKDVQKPETATQRAIRKAIKGAETAALPPTDLGPSARDLFKNEFGGMRLPKISPEDIKSTLRGVPYQAAHLGLGYFPFVAGKELGDTDLLPNDPVLDLDPISATTALAAAEVATPYLVDFPLGLAKGQGIGGALQSAAQVARAGLQRLPFMAAVYGTAYGMGHLMDWSRKQREPQFQKDMQEYKSRQAALETRRRKEGREETTGEATKRVWELNNILQSYISPTGPQF